MTFEPLTAERRRQQTRDYLLQAAAQVFAERGYHAASIDEVAAAAGYTKGAVYSNFKNKEDLFLALIESAYNQELARLRTAYEGSDVPPENRLSDFVGLVRDQLDNMPDNWGMLRQEFNLYAMRNPAARARLTELEEMDIAVISDLIRDGRTRMGVDVDESPESAARIVVALFQGIGLMRMLNPDAIDERLMADALTFVVRALGQQAPQVEKRSSPRG
jgi:AcrR family transcriptional regulator